MAQSSETMEGASVPSAFRPASNEPSGLTAVRLKPPARASRPDGWIDWVGGAGECVHGWAFSPAEAPALISFFYYGELYCTAFADEYRPDVEATGIGTGVAGFTVPLPCPSNQFDPRFFAARHRDGTLLSRSVNFLGWRPANFSSIANFDLLSSPFTSSAYLEFTSRCNLRCVYCAVSQPTYVGQDIEASVLDEAIRVLQARKVDHIQVNAHGETTMVPDWHRQINALAAVGLDLRIITNFARLLSPEELAAMARIRRICVSIDTHRPEVLRKIRRNVSLGNILINMANTAAKAAELNLPCPEFIWNCVVTDKVASDFLDYLRFGITLGVKTFFVANLTKHEDVAGADNVKHVTTLPDAELKQFAQMLDEGCRLVDGIGGYIEVEAGLTDTVLQELDARGLR
jgi:hypothetical protein